MVVITIKTEKDRERKKSVDAANKQNEEKLTYVAGSLGRVSLGFFDPAYQTERSLGETAICVCVCTG